MHLSVARHKIETDWWDNFCWCEACGLAHALGPVNPALTRVTDRPTDRRTDGQTYGQNHDCLDHASIAALRGKNQS